MFTNHFKMNALPFTERIPCERILKDERLNQALARLQYFLSDGSIALVTGHTGAGKSSLIKLFLQSVQNHGANFHPVYLYITDLRITSILKFIVSGLGETPRHTKGLVFKQIVDITKRSRASIVIIIDEAQLLTPEALTDLRLLVSSALDEIPPVKIILSGQQKLRQTLKFPALADLANRITIHYHLPALTTIQTYAYITHHLRSVGANENIFDRSVTDLIHEFSAGLPRQINNIATACLIQAHIQKVYRVDHHLFSQAAADCRL